MKKNHLIILAGLLAALVAAYFFVQRPKTSKVAGFYRQVTPAFDIDSINSIDALVLSHPDTMLHLRKGKTGWVVEMERDGEKFQAPARDSKVKRLLGILRDMQGELRAQGSNHFATFNIGQKEGLKITVSSTDGKQFTLVVGKKGPDWSSSFVRKADSDKIFLVSKNILAAFDIWSEKPDKDLNLKSWVNMDVISVFPDDVKRCSYESKDLSWSLTRANANNNKNNGQNKSTIDKKGGKATWIFKTGDTRQKESAAEVEEYLSKLLPLHAKDIEAPSAATKSGRSQDSAEKMASFSCTVESGPEITVTIDRCLDKEKYCLVRRNNYIFKVDKTWVQRLQKPFVSHQLSH